MWGGGGGGWARVQSAGALRERGRAWGDQEGGRADRQPSARRTWFSSAPRPPSVPAADTTALQSPAPGGGEPDGGRRPGPGWSRPVTCTSVAGGGERREGDHERLAAALPLLRNAAARGTAAGRSGERDGERSGMAAAESRT
jgi:hypothetical protein